MVGNIRRAEVFADVLEVRFDCLSSDLVREALDSINRTEIVIPLIATYRSPDQGGKREVGLGSRTEFWQTRHERFWAADLEEDVFQAANKWTKKIISFHDFRGVKPDVNPAYERMALSGADVIKIAVAADDVASAIAVWQLLARAKTDNKQMIPIAMGEAGKWTRILGLANGAYMTYAALDTCGETAPGQLTVIDLIEVYRVKELDTSTKVYGVIGNPVSGSLSPYMHNPAFVSAGFNAVFIPLQVTDLEAFMQLMVREASREVELNFAGFSVTMPHKQTIMKYLDAIDPVAEAIGAVNTVRVVGDKLIGYNTDAHGFITPLRAKFGDLKDTRVAVLGAGGAARACVYALKQEGAVVTVFARDEAKAKALAEKFDTAWSTISKLKDQRSKLVSTDILVNTTPLGMTGPFENETLLTAEGLSGLKFVYDLVTRPEDTRLIAEAKKAGVRAVGGVEMLAAQAAKQFEIWTGVKVSAAAMEASALAKWRERGS
jgi:3-dehydroquinate dehydratase/shikimate dehydrogenase